MLALILAAGTGSRLLPLTADKPKCFVNIHGKPLLDWQLFALQAAGIQHTSIVTGYCADQITSAYALRISNFIHNPNFAATNMLTSLMLGLDHLDSDIIVSYADIAYPPQTVKKLSETPGDIVLAIDLDWLTLWRMRFADPLTDAESLKFDATSGKLLDIGRHVESFDEIQAQYMGLFKFSQRGLDQVKTFYQVMRDNLSCGLNDPAQAELNTLSMTEFFSHMLKSGTPIHVCPINGDWLELDSLEDLKLYEQLAKDKNYFLNR